MHALACVRVCVSARVSVRVSTHVSARKYVRGACTHVCALVRMQAVVAWTALACEGKA